MARVKLYDNPPDGRNRLNWDEADEIAIALIDNPGKWALMVTRENPKYRGTEHLVNRYGEGFTFRTHANNDTGFIEIWGCYGGEENGEA